MNALWYSPHARSELRQAIGELGPWYQQIHLGAGIWTRPWSHGQIISQWLHCERDWPKFRRFLWPVLRTYLRGATVLELGCNAGGILIQCLRHGARRCYGVEPDELYLDQALFVRRQLGLQGQLVIVPLLTSLIGSRSTDTVDIGLLCAVLRHVGQDSRPEMLAKMASVCRRVVIQGNGLSSAPDGDSLDSIVRYITQAELQVETIRHQQHVRGVVVVARKP